MFGLPELYVAVLLKAFREMKIIASLKSNPALVVQGWAVSSLQLL
jgi:hypothetical protein